MCLQIKSWENELKEELIRTSFLLGKENVKKLNESKVIVFGVGGVGGYTVEALARSGVGAFILVDNDTVSVSNINRQIIATHDTVGRYKTEVMKERILSINKDAVVEIYNMFYLPDNADEISYAGCDYVIDAVDTVTAKIEIIMRAKKEGVPVISSMGTGNKINPLALEIADIFDTSICPLAKVMRKELRKRGIESLKVIYSKEEPVNPLMDDLCMYDDEAIHAQKNVKEDNSKRIKCPPGSVSFVPSVAGLIIASEVVKDIISV